MAPISSIVVFLQGLFGVANGAVSVLIPSAAEANAKLLGVDSIAAIHTIGLGSVCIGAAYINAAYRKDTSLMWICVLGRFLSIPMFLQHGGQWRNVAYFEGACGALIAGALVWDGWRGKEKEKGA